MATAAGVADTPVLSYRNVNYWAGIISAVDNLRLHAISFLDAFAPMNDDVVAERTVRNWKVPARQVALALPTAFSFTTLEYVNDVALIVYNASMAAYWAVDAGRITVAQGNAYTAAWNTAWGF